MMESCLVILSGGMDSATVLALAIKNTEGEKVNCLSFDYGSKHNEMELKAAKELCSAYNVEHKIMKLDFMSEHFKSDLLQSGGDIPEGHYQHESMKKTVVPFRNGIMLAIAAGYAESIGLKFIAIGNHFGDHAIYPDCRSSFIDPMTVAIKNGTEKGIEVFSPFCDSTKSDIVRIGIQLGLDYSKTYSCYNGREKHCGKCGTCVERKEAFRDCYIKDPTEYEGEA